MPTFTSPVTGAAQTGLTSPTYTIVTDTPPSYLAKQVYVSALGGTQTGVLPHSGSNPFTTTIWRPAQIKQIGKVNPTSGLLPTPPRNVFKYVTRKGVLPLAGQPYQTMVVTTTIEMVAGSDLAAPTDVRAALSMHFGCIAQQSAAIGDGAIQGVI